MVLPVNPYCLLPVYAGRPATAGVGYLHSPVEKAPHFQFYVPGTYSPVAAFEIYTPSTGSSATLSTALIEEADNDGAGTFYTYKGGTLTAPLTSGLMQQLVVTLDNGDVYSTKYLCPFLAFDGEAIDLTLVSCVNPSSGVFTFTFSAGVPIGAGHSVLVADNNSSATAYKNNSFTISNGFATAVLGGFSINVTVQISLEHPQGGAMEITKVYRLTFTSADPCGTLAITPLTSSYNYGENLHLLQSTNSTADRPDLLLMHQTGFIQQLYFMGFSSAPTPVIEETYTDRADGKPVFNGAVSRRQYALDFYPCPDELITAIGTLRSANGTTITTFGQSANIAEQIALSITPVEGDSVSAGRLSFVMDSARLARCNEDFTITVL